MLNSAWGYCSRKKKKKQKTWTQQNARKRAKPNTHFDSFMIYVGSGALSSAKQAELVKKDHLGGAIDTYTEVLFLTLMVYSQTSLP